MLLPSATGSQARSVNMRTIKTGPPKAGKRGQFRGGSSPGRPLGRDGRTDDE